MKRKATDYKRSTKRSRTLRKIRGTRKRNAKATRYTSKVLMGKGFPKQTIMTHVYQEFVKLSNVGGAAAFYAYRANGMYDPNQTGGGHQPMFFDQMSALYDHYCVIGSKITVTLTHGAQTNVAANVALYVDDDTTPVTGPSEAAEQHGAKYRTLPAGSPYNVVMVKKWSAKKMFGAGVLANTELQGTSSSDPTEQSLFFIVTKPMDGTSSQDIYANIKIEYIAVWKELKTIPIS